MTQEPRPPRLKGPAAELVGLVTVAVLCVLGTALLFVLTFGAWAVGLARIIEWTLN